VPAPWSSTSGHASSARRCAAGVRCGCLAGVADADLHERAVVLQRQAHRASRLGVAQGVVDQVLQHALDHRDVRQHPGLAVAAGGSCSFTPRSGRRAGSSAPRPAAARPGRKPLSGAPNGRIQFGQLERGRHPLAQQVCVAQRGAQVPGAGFDVDAVATQHHRFHIAPDVGKRRAQVVRDVAHQLAPLAVAVVELPELPGDAVLHVAHRSAQHLDFVPVFDDGHRAALGRNAHNASVSLRSGRVRWCHASHSTSAASAETAAAATAMACKVPELPGWRPRPAPGGCSGRCTGSCPHARGRQQWSHGKDRVLPG
jgi:hypothetical protein